MTPLLAHSTRVAAALPGLAVPVNDITIGQRVRAHSTRTPYLVHVNFKFRFKMKRDARKGPGHTHTVLLTLTPTSGTAIIADVVHSLGARRPSMLLYHRLTGGELLAAKCGMSASVICEKRSSASIESPTLSDSARNLPGRHQVNTVHVLVNQRTHPSATSNQSGVSSSVHIK